jgi:hypothetical protein
VCLNVQCSIPALGFSVAGASAAGVAAGASEELDG